MFLFLSRVAFVGLLGLVGCSDKTIDIGALKAEPGQNASDLFRSAHLVFREETRTLIVSIQARLGNSSGDTVSFEPPAAILFEGMPMQVENHLKADVASPEADAEEKTLPLDEEAVLTMKGGSMLIKNLSGHHLGTAYTLTLENVDPKSQYEVTWIFPDGRKEIFPVRMAAPVSTVVENGELAWTGAESQEEEAAGIIAIGEETPEERQSVILDAKPGERIPYSKAFKIAPRKVRAFALRLLSVNESSAENWDYSSMYVSKIRGADADED